MDQLGSSQVLNFFPSFVHLESSIGLKFKSYFHLSYLIYISAELTKKATGTLFMKNNNQFSWKKYKKEIYISITA